MSNLNKKSLSKSSNKTKIAVFSFFIGIILGLGITSAFKQFNNTSSFTRKSIFNINEKSMEVLFTPGDQCTDRIVEHIMSAKQEILVQAYSFTSSPIINALIIKHQEGVKIIIILDKSQEKSIFAFKVHSAGIKVLIDKLPGIAHNKVIVIDRKKVFTGSFNFSKAAQSSNAENSLLIYDLIIVEKYLNNFFSRMKKSFPFKNAPIMSKL